MEEIKSMKKTLFAIAAMAMMMASCEKDGKEEEKGGMPVVSKIEVVVEVKANAKMTEAFNFMFYGNDFDGKEYGVRVKEAMDGTAVLCSKENPELSENEKDNVFEISYQPVATPGFKAAEKDEFIFNYTLSVRAYDKKGKLFSSSAFENNTHSVVGPDGLKAATQMFEREAYSGQKRGVWMSKTLSGEWHIGADRL